MSFAQTSEEQPPDNNVTVRLVELCRLAERYLPPDKVDKIYAAFNLAADAHKGVFRKTGDPYITHPLEVARILADLHMDVDSICAALLHDVIEDTPYQYDDLAIQFGDTVADLVEGVTKLSSHNFQSKHEAGIASFKKMMEAMVQDFRVVIIKLADRLHNASTLGGMKPASRRRIAKETLEIHVPLARRMGMNALRHNLQNHAFEHLYPVRSAVIKKWWNHCSEVNKEARQQIQTTLETALEDEGIDCTVFYWEKNLYRLYEREKRRPGKKNFNREGEALEIRILTKNLKDCYCALGILHKVYPPKVASFRDFIAVPKVYGFQALQTTLIAPDQQIIRIQIQSREMYQVAQYGVAAQWRFPHLNKDNGTDLSQERLYNWLEQVSEIQQATENATEFLEDMKADFFFREVTVLTPAGQSKNLRIGATPVDFAYAIHTEIGNHCKHALIDGQEVPLNTQLHDGETVKIITSDEATPHPSWLNFTVTGKARSAIRNWLGKRHDDEFISLGENMLRQAMAIFGSTLGEIEETDMMAMLKDLDFNNENALFQAIAKGDQCSKLIARRLMNNAGLQMLKDKNQPLYIKGTQGIAVNLEKCCNPIPGDTIIAVLDPDQGLNVHRTNCPTLRHQKDADTITLAWETEQNLKYFAAIKIHAKNQVGVLHSITEIFHEQNVNIEDLNISGDENTKEMRILIKVEDTRHLQSIAKKLQHEKQVIEVSRILNLSL
jgi:RelA/SpoT family (p)ppGpp synthetase